jgi:DNA-directed RNA polymerase specialized sigma24 family protein
LADDAVALAFQVAWQQPEAVPVDPDQAVAWLVGVAWNRVRNERRAERRRLNRM